jgi:hypothetical protein
MVIQLRIGKIGFRSFLLNSKVLGVQDPTYECGEDMAVPHPLFNCMRWRDLRATALQGLNRGSLPKLLSTSKECLAAARMVLHTELLAQFRESDLEREVEWEGR